jgi:hypothetical protein
VEPDPNSVSAQFQRVLLRRAVLETQDREQLIALVRDFVSQRARDEREGEKLAESSVSQTGVEKDSELGRLASRLQVESQQPPTTPLLHPHPTTLHTHPHCVTATGGAGGGGW